MKKLWIILILSLLLVACNTDEGPDMSGYYEGFIDVMGNKLNIEVTLEKEEDYTGFVDIPVQGAYGLQISNVLVDGEKINFDMNAGSSMTNFDGIFENDTIKGDFTQSGQTFGFELVKTEKIEKEVNNRLEVENGDIKLIGEWLVPETEAEMPVVLIIAGSGPTDMDGNSAAGVSAQPYKLMAEALYEKGIASLRYNKRFINNAIAEKDLSFDDFTADAKFLTQMLLEDSRFNEVIIVGHSQGALIAELVAKDLALDKVVLLAGAGQSIDGVLENQLTAGLTEELLNEAVEIMVALKKGETVDDVPEALVSLFRKDIQPFFTAWMQHDPVELLNHIDEEVMVIVGTTDLQVPVSEGELFLNSDKEVTYAVIENMNHVLKETTADQAENIASYSNPDLPIHETLMEELIQFILQ